MLFLCQVPHVSTAGACRWDEFCPSSASLDLTSPSQGVLSGYNQASHRATISAVSKNVPARARPACRSTTSGLTSQTGFEAVLRGCAGRYPRRGHHYPRKRCGFSRSQLKTAPRKGNREGRRALPPHASRQGLPRTRVGETGKICTRSSVDRTATF